MRTLHNFLSIVLSIGLFTHEVNAMVAIASFHDGNHSIDFVCKRLAGSDTVR